jgi:hypothetical protein
MYIYMQAGGVNEVGQKTVAAHSMADLVLLYIHSDLLQRQHFKNRIFGILTPRCSASLPSVQEARLFEAFISQPYDNATIDHRRSLYHHSVRSPKNHGNLNKSGGISTTQRTEKPATKLPHSANGIAPEDEMPPSLKSPPTMSISVPENRHLSNVASIATTVARKAILIITATPPATLPTSLINAAAAISATQRNRVAYAIEVNGNGEGL